MFIKRLPHFEYHTPASLPEAFDLLSTYGKDAKLLAGGTDLILAMKKRTATPSHLINLKTIPGLSGITANGEGLRIGALTTMAEIERSGVIREDYSPLWDAACVMASPQVRTLATVGGNLVSAVPSADTAPPLMVLSAQAHITGLSGERTCPVEDLFSGPSTCNIAPTDILTHITIPFPKGKGVYLKIMRRAALDLALVGVAAFLSMDGGNVCTDVKIALGAVAPTPIRAALAEGILRGKALTEALADEAGKSAGRECRPISDVRASEEYRRNMVEVLTKRALLRTMNTLNQGGTR
ncbi:MAG: xanthine dehydrogenase family protein subunit M [Deltaproteobacteria bacterium]|nr:xanthine dehydrogenase family protein subunit M [Deltaproteobacteria bacterium]